MKTIEIVPVFHCFFRKISHSFTGKSLRYSILSNQVFFKILDGMKEVNLGESSFVFLLAENLILELGIQEVAKRYIIDSEQICN